MIELQVHFENHKNRIEEELIEAKHTVHIAVAWINFKSYYSIFHSLLKKSISLSIPCTDNKANKSHIRKIEELRSQGAKIKLLKMPSANNHMHHKFAIIDNNVLLNGSFNWTPNSTRGFENLMIIKNAPDQIKSFKNEFNNLSKIETETIKKLRRKNKCKIKGCDGRLHNILVFSERSSKYHETYGDIVTVCNECYDYEKLDELISNTQIEILIQELSAPKDDYELEFIESHLNDLLMGYQNDEKTIHAIGRVNTQLEYDDEETVSTHIIWKNKFVGDEILDTYENEDFEVLYDN